MTPFGKPPLAAPRPSFWVSMRLRFLLERYLLGSLATAVIDYAVFIAAYGATRAVPLSIALSRALAVGYNFFWSKKLVFHARRRWLSSLGRYLLLVGANALLAAVLIDALSAALGLPAVAGKVLVELALYLPSFWLQKQFIFRE